MLSILSLGVVIILLFMLVVVLKVGRLSSASFTHSWLNMVIEGPGLPAIRKLSSVDEDRLALIQDPSHVSVLVAIQL